jgi:hypothetical protein
MCEELEENKFQYLKDECEDLISELLYYNRRECDVVSVQDIKKLSNTQIDQLSEHIRNCVLENLK